MRIWPGQLSVMHEIALAGALEQLAVVVDERRLHAEERQRGRAGLEVDGAGQRRDQDAAGLGLPPGVDDRAAVVADDAVVPEPGLGIDRLADRAQQAQATCARSCFTGSSPFRISARIAVGAV